MQHDAHIQAFKKLYYQYAYSERVKDGCNYVRKLKQSPST